MRQLTFWIFLGIFKLSLALNETCILKSGIVGTCKPIAECDIILTALNSDDLSHLQSCHFTGEIGIYCCPISSFKMNSKLTHSCQKIIQTKELLRINSTKYDEESSILSFMAQIFISDKGFVGSGVLLSEKFVLTSAHAVYVRRSMPIVRLGMSTLDKADSLPILNINVKQVIPHELFIPREAYYDIALLLLKQSVKLNDLTFPVCLYNSQIELSNAQNFIRDGWKGNELMKTEVQKVPESKCDAIYNRIEYKVKLPDGISNSLFCGRSKECSVNSDGPIHVLINNTFFIYGFSTAINTNCNSELPGLYTKISDVVKWIEHVISSIDSP